MFKNFSVAHKHFRQQARSQGGFDGFERTPLFKKVIAIIFINNFKLMTSSNKNTGYVASNGVHCTGLHGLVSKAKRL